MTLNIFGSKARTLEKLAQLVKKSTVEDYHIITEEGWFFKRRKLLEDIIEKFGGDTVIVRSSALNEDSIAYSNAGAFESVLNVNSADSVALASSIDEVVSSYKRKNSSDPRNQVLIQRQTQDVTFSGVVLTRHYNGAPYYVINFSQGDDTTLVTAGKNGGTIKILRNHAGDSQVELSGVLESVQEIEELVGVIPLDYEFAVKRDGTVVTFQARPLAASLNTLSFDIDQVFQRVETLKERYLTLSKRKIHLAGEYTILADMPDWNPAEIIGGAPNRLAFSLYSYIITDRAWHEARTSQGYFNVAPAPLVHLIGNKPYVDSRSSFNSFTPATLPEELRERLVAFYLDKLRENPHLQDKVEFDVAYTIYDPSFLSRSRELRAAGFSASDMEILRDSLLELTNSLLDKNQIERDLATNMEMEEERKSLKSQHYGGGVSDSIERAFTLLDVCRDKGTVQFSRLARQGFVGKLMLNSLLETGAISESFYHGLLASIETVATEFSKDANLFRSGQITEAEFMEKYGHLRPGTYDITIPRYDQSSHYHTGEAVPLDSLIERERLEITESEHKNITHTLEQHGIGITSEELLQFIRASFAAREYSKFLFTKCLSDAIEAIAEAGERVGLSREDMSYLDLDTVKRGQDGEEGFVRAYWGNVIATNRRQRRVDNLVCLPAVISSAEDFFVIKSYQPKPNYITSMRSEGELICLDEVDMATRQDIVNKVVAIEAADPGYDWIFSKNPAGLVTKYGGVASHMAIRCAEFSIPAAIGCGDLYDKVKEMQTVTLDCAKEQISEGGQAL